jgi:hypothetical protein
MDTFFRVADKNDFILIVDLGQIPRYVFILDVENLLFYEKNQKIQVNYEAIDFLLWVMNGERRETYRPRIIVWTDVYTPQRVLTLLSKTFQKYQNNHSGRNTSIILPHIIDKVKGQGLNLYTNGVKDWGKLRRRLYSFGELYKAQHTLTFFLSPTSCRSYSYNICYMQQYRFNSISVMMQTFSDTSNYIPHRHYQSYLTTLDGFPNFIVPQTFHILSNKERDRISKTKGYRFHDVRRTLEFLSLDSSYINSLVNLEQRAFEFFLTPSLIECPYMKTLSGKENKKNTLPDYILLLLDRISIVLILDLKPIQINKYKTFQYVDDFLSVFFHMDKSFVGHVVESLLLHCHPFPNENFCETLQEHVIKRLQDNVNVSFQTATGFYWDSSLPFIDVVWISNYESNTLREIPISMMEAVEYGIASRLPRSTSIFIKITETFPMDLDEHQSSSKIGENHICYTNFFKKKLQRSTKKKKSNGICLHLNFMSYDSWKKYFDRLYEKKLGQEEKYLFDRDDAVLPEFSEPSQFLFLIIKKKKMFFLISCSS